MTLMDYRAGECLEMAFNGTVFLSSFLMWRDSSLLLYSRGPASHMMLTYETEVRDI